MFLRVFAFQLQHLRFGFTSDMRRQPYEMSLMVAIMYQLSLVWEDPTCAFQCASRWLLAPACLCGFWRQYTQAM